MTKVKRTWTGSLGEIVPYWWPSQHLGTCQFHLKLKRAAANFYLGGEKEAHWRSVVQGQSTLLVLVCSFSKTQQPPAFPASQLGDGLELAPAEPPIWLLLVRKWSKQACYEKHPSQAKIYLAREGRDGFRIKPAPGFHAFIPSYSITSLHVYPGLRQKLCLGTLRPVKRLDWTYTLLPSGWPKSKQTAGLRPSKLPPVRAASASWP